jgi:hypothetical protein
MNYSLKNRSIIFLNRERGEEREERRGEKNKILILCNLIKRLFSCNLETKESWKKKIETLFINLNISTLKQTLLK